MATTTISVPSFHSPSDDPTLDLRATIVVPDPIAFPGPSYPCWCGTQTPGFGGDGSYSGAQRIMQTLAEAGILCMAFQARSDDILSGQMTDGTFPQQEDDCAAAVRYMRPGHEIETVHGFSVNGFVGIAGGSGSAEHAVWRVLNGTAGDDKADAAIALSPPTDYSNRNDVTPEFISKTAKYADLVDTDLAGLRAVSPIASNLAAAKPLRHYNGTAEAMPLSQITDFQDDMAAAGAVGYVPIINSSDQLKNLHSFAMWQFVAAESTQWALEQIAAFTGGTVPPPPDQTGRVKVTAVITNLSPGLPYTLNVSAIDTTSALEGPSTAFDFISDKADTGGVGKDPPVGVYALVNTVDGVLVGDYTTRAWKNFAYVDGAIFPTTWGTLNPTSRSSFNWTALDTFLAFCVANSKSAGISISCGIKDPSWIYSGGHAVAGFFENGPNSGTIPIPWDPSYLAVIKKFIIEMATRYDTNTALNHVVVGGMGQLLDTILVQQPGDYTNLNNNAVIAGFPDLITAWSTTSQGILDIWTKAFRTTPVYLAINLPVPSGNGGLTGIDEFTRASIDHYRGRFGVMSLELDGLTSFDANLSINKIIHDANRSPRAYQFRRPSSDPACDPTQDPGSYVPELGLRNAANAGIDIGVQMEHFFESDILTVTGAYPADFAQFQTDLTANA